MKKNYLVEIWKFIVWRHFNMKTTIGIKIGFAFFVLVLLFGAGGTTIYYKVNDGMNTLNKIKEDAQRQIKIGNLRFAVTQVLMATNDYIITNKEYYKQEYQKQNALLEKDYQVFIQSGLTYEEKQLTYEISTLIDSIRMYSERIFSMTNPRQSSDAWKLMEIIDYHYGTTINAKTSLIYDGISERIQENSANAEMIKKKIILLVQCAVLISLVLGIIIIYLSIVRIARPIKKIAEVAGLIAKGNYTKRLSIKTHDEVASLAESFNQMSESIRQTQEALEDSKRFAESIIETEPECVCVISKQGILKSINPAGLRIIDADTPEQVVGKPVEHLIAIEHLQAFKNLNENVHKGESGILQYEIVGLKGRRRWIEKNAAPLYNSEGHIVGNLGISRDITESKQTEKALRESEHHYRTLVNSGYALIWTSGLDKLCDYFNDPWLNFTGRTLEQELGNGWVEGVHPDDLQHCMNIYNSHFDRRVPFSIEYRLRKSDGEYSWIFDIGNPRYDSKGNFMGYIGFCYNITDRKLTEMELIKAKEKAQESDRLKTAFLNNISHEIRTPLNGIMGFAPFVIQPEITLKEKEEYLEILNSSSERLMNTVTDYMDISLIVSDNMKVHPKPIDVSSILTTVHKRFQNRCSKKNIAFNTQFPDNAGNFVLNTDGEMLNKSVSKLVDNSVKFTKEGRITLGFKLINNEIEIFVKDTGIGIEEGAQVHMFEYFMQENVATTRGHEGSGLGLSIVKGLMRLLGGKVRLESAQNKGTTVVLTLPVDTTVTSVKPKNSTNALNVGAIPLILIAEDDDYSYLFLETLLKKDNKVLRACNGQEAVDLCKKHLDIGLVLMDIKMPVMNGMEATQIIKSFRTDLPIIAVTAHAQSGDESKIKEVGCDEYISKPIDITKLLSLIQKYLRSNAE